MKNLKLKAARAGRDWSQQQLAEAVQTLQIHTGTVNLIDKNNCRDLQLL